MYFNLEIANGYSKSSLGYKILMAPQTSSRTIKNRVIRVNVYPKKPQWGQIMMVYSRLYMTWNISAFKPIIYIAESREDSNSRKGMTRTAYLKLEKLRPSAYHNIWKKQSEKRCNATADYSWRTVGSGDCPSVPPQCLYSPDPELAF